VKSFRELSRRSRLYRLRQLANAALVDYGLRGAHLCFLQYSENITYRVEMPGTVHPSDDTNPYVPNRYVLRIHAMGDVESITSELTWLAALSRATDIPVPAPISTPDSKLLTTIVTPGIPNGRVVSLMRWLDGKRLHKGQRPKHLHALGQVVAHLHNFSASWQPPGDFNRPHWDWDSMLGGSMFRHSMRALVKTIPSKFRGPFQTVSQEAKCVMDSLGKGLDAYGLTHADLYPENVLYKAGKAFPIDYEDCGFGYWIWDIALALSPWAWEHEWEQMRDAFQEGYGQIRALPKAQWAQLDFFVAAQFATMVIWSSAFIKNDPKRIIEYESMRNYNGNKLLAYFNR
jgi:Ser/Thr protein kinase RdoA (MazF antagonist)